MLTDFSPLAKVNLSHEAICALRLIRSQNVGNRTFWELIRVFGSAANAIDKVQEMSLKGGRKKPIELFSLVNAKLEMQRVEDAGACIIAYCDPLYPKALKNISDAPPIITAIGNTALLNSRAVAIVGARNCSLAGASMAQQLAAGISAAGVVIVSGFARGIDTAAHKASLANGTVAVLAGGADHIYPQENRQLYYEIAKQGCIVAELPFGANPSAQHFPQRNRIISGLSLATVVVEAALGSGSLITAHLALEQGRDVFAVPGFPSDARYKGNNKLLKSGAIMVEGPCDVLQNLGNFATKPLSSTLEDKTANMNIKTNTNAISAISESNRQQLLTLLSVTPVEIETLVSVSQLPLSAVYFLLLELELAGKITRHHGNKISLAF